MVVLKSTTCIFNVDLPLFVTKMQKLQIMVRIMNLNARFLRVGETIDFFAIFFHFLKIFLGQKHAILNWP